jgi:D-glycero-D-manno-heptose 1,7-bisphosphate phosphatase
MPARAVFFDRDGVLNRALVRDGRPFPPAADAEFEWMEGVHETLTALKERGYVLLVFTNQPDVARGTQTLAQLESFHGRIAAELPVARVYACTHDDVDGCACRKPKPGMILQGQADYDLVLEESWVVGDRWRDIEAGRAAGCKTILVQHDYREKRVAADHEVRNIPDLLEIIKRVEGP